MAEALSWIRGKQVSVRYWVTRQEVSKAEAQEHFIRELMGNGDARFGARYSDLTGYLWTDEELKVGGHDLINELKGHAGNWLILEVDHK